jgi:DNA-binding response OmpR family regulator
VHNIDCSIHKRSGVDRFVDFEMMLVTACTRLNKEYLLGQEKMPTRVLVVDDDNETADLLRIILENDDFLVNTATSGREGIEMTRKIDPDVILLDLLIPDMDGFTVCREVRKFSSIPIVVLSAVSNPGLVTQALDVGADDYLTKPIYSNVLVACLNKLTRRARAEQEVRANGVYRMM